MSGLARLVFVAVAAYVVIGLVYATGASIYYEFFAKNPGALAPPWSGPIAFLVWFVVPAALWPWNVVGLSQLPEILVATVYLATVGLFYLAASRRLAPRRLRSTYPDHH